MGEVEVDRDWVQPIWTTQPWPPDRVLPWSTNPGGGGGDRGGEG